MSAVATNAIAEVYSTRFNNLDEVSHPSIFFEPAFGALLQKAIDRNSPLTQAEVEAVFEGISWEW